MNSEQSSPIMNVLLVPSVILVIFMDP